MLFELSFIHELTTASDLPAVDATHAVVNSYLMVALLFNRYSGSDRLRSFYGMPAVSDDTEGIHQVKLFLHSNGFINYA